MTQPMTQAEKQQAYDAWYIAEVEKGIAAVEAGQVLSDEQAKHQKRGQTTVFRGWKAQLESASPAKTGAGIRLTSSRCQSLVRANS